MEWSVIRSMRTVYSGASKIHESIFRSYNILQKTKDYLKRGVPADVILELIAEAENAGIEVGAKEQHGSTKS